MNYEEAEKQSLILTENLCNNILKNIPNLVIGGWAITAYCGNIRFTADIDVITLPLTTMPVKKAFNKDWITRKVFYGVQAENKKLGIQAHINTIAYIPDRSTKTRIIVPNEIFNNIKKEKVRGLYYKGFIEIPVCPFSYLLTLKAIPNRIKDDFDFALLMLNENYNRNEFINYLTKYAIKKHFIEKCKRLSNRAYFFSLSKTLITNYNFNIMQFNAINKELEKIKELI